jgi:adenylate cyclase
VEWQYPSFRCPGILSLARWNLMGTLGQASSSDRLLEIAAWTTEAGLSGLAEGYLLRGFCERALAAGIPLARATFGIDTLHPELDARIFYWRRNAERPISTDYVPADRANARDLWLGSPFYRLLQSGERLLRLRPAETPRGEFPFIDECREEGITDYVALVDRFGSNGSIGEMDCTFSSFASDHPRGFADGDLDALGFLVPGLGLAMKSIAVMRISETLVETYLGRDAGRRVLSGRIRRGVADRIEAALWFSDLRDFTRIAEAAPAEQLIPFLNDYADAIITAIDGVGGDVLKLLGDGILAVFTQGDAAARCGGALAAEKEARRRVAALNGWRAAAGLRVTDFYLGLHVGEVFYGNIGSIARLDFTVVGVAVNEVSRIAALCRSVDQPVLASSAFAERSGDARSELVSVGRYALRGLQKPQELFTLEPRAGA